MKSIATTVIWPWLQLAAVVIGGNNGAEALHTRIRPFSVRCIVDDNALEPPSKGLVMASARSFG